LRDTKEEWLRLPILLVIVIVMLPVLAVRAEPQDPDSLELQATQALTRGQYGRALPLLEKLVEQVADEPMRRERIEEQIRLARRNLEQQQEPDAQARLIDRILPIADQVPQTAEQRKAHAPPVDGEVRELSIRQLGNFEYDEERGGNVPEDVLRLSGMTVRMHGFMIPREQAVRIRRFTLVADLMACCFGQPPQVHHAIEVSVPAGKSVPFTPHEIVVEGVLKVDEKTDDGWIVSLFEMEASSVKRAAQ
jgi:hypothetical protein